MRRSAFVCRTLRLRPASGIMYFIKATFVSERYQSARVLSEAGERKSVMPRANFSLEVAGRQTLRMPKASHPCLTRFTMRNILFSK